MKLPRLPSKTYSSFPQTLKCHCIASLHLQGNSGSYLQIQDGSASGTVLWRQYVGNDTDASMDFTYPIDVPSGAAYISVNGTINYASLSYIAAADSVTFARA